ncbi:hypothetical protein PHISP_01826 [Aspergillus sp. HF37]|nr:hypothetical protein PHISP_01826 [Aspergillus sp. HF37]
MVAHEEDRAVPSSDVIPLTRMPQQTGVWTPDDDWTGIISQMERRKLQNRQNQRAYRASATTE